MILTRPNNGENHELLEKELSGINGFLGCVFYENEIQVHFEGDVNVSEIDSIISAHNPDPVYPLIWDVCLPGLKGLDPKEINYKIQLASGETLYDKMTFSKDGFLEVTEYYYGWVDAQNPGSLCIKVEEFYTTEPSQAQNDPCVREIIQREKIWTYYNNDGSVYAEYTKVKKYDTRQKKSSEAIRRRQNIVDSLLENLATAGVLSGTFFDSEDAKESITALFNTHSKSMNAYEKSGRGPIFADIQNDLDNTWLSDLVADNPMTGAMVPWMVGSTFRQYIIDKLKGLVK